MSPDDEESPGTDAARTHLRGLLGNEKPHDIGRRRASFASIIMRAKIDSRPLPQVYRGRVLFALNRGSRFPAVRTAVHEVALLDDRNSRVEGSLRSARREHRRPGLCGCANQGGPFPPLLAGTHDAAGEQGLRAVRSRFSAAGPTASSERWAFHAVS